MMEKNHEFFMKKAIGKARNALAANEFPVGCVIVCEGEIIAGGYRKGSAGKNPNETEHAEIMAIRNLGRIERAIDRSKVTIYCTMEPCLMCFSAILFTGIGELVYAYEDAMGGGTSCDLTKLAPLYRNSKINIVPNIMRSESLKIFKAFFENPKNSYWKGSLLSDYTLSQP